jgi:hypothetical protein
MLPYFSRRLHPERRGRHQPVRHVPPVGHARGEQGQHGRGRGPSLKLPDSSKPAGNAGTADGTKHSGSPETYLPDDECKRNQSFFCLFCILAQLGLFE